MLGDLFRGLLGGEPVLRRQPQAQPERRARRAAGAVDDDLLARPVRVVQRGENGVGGALGVDGRSYPVEASCFHLLLQRSPAPKCSQCCQKLVRKPKSRSRITGNIVIPLLLKGKRLA